jgi:hypothetical protein
MLVFIILKILHYLSLLLLCLLAGCQTVMWKQVVPTDPMVSTFENGPAERDRVVIPFKFRVSRPGAYSLYRVTKWGSHDVPQDATVVATCDLREGDAIESRWTDATGNEWTGYHGTDLMTEAGGRQFHLSKADQPTRYYWAYDAYWTDYWRQKSARDRISLIIAILLLPIAGGRAQ